MLSTLGQGALLYVFNKSDAILNTAEVILVLPAILNYNFKYMLNNFMHKPAVNIRAIVDGEEVMFLNLSSDAVIADNGNGIVISENKELMVKEILNVKQSSEKILLQTDHYKHVIEKCDTILASLDPYRKKDVEKEEELSKMKNDICNIQQMLTLILNNNNLKQ